MSLCTRLLRMIMAFSLLCSSALADVPSELKEVIFNGALNGRSSVDFTRKARNVTSLIPAGTHGDVLETRKLKSGSYGVKVRITTLGNGKTKAKVNDEVWVYYSQKDPWLDFKDKNDEDVDDPEEALTAKAKKDGEGIPAPGIVQNPSLPTKEEVLATQKPEDPNLAKEEDKTKTEAGICETCLPGTSNKAQNEKALKDISDISYAISKNPNEPMRNKEAGKWADFPEVVKYSDSSKVKSALKYAMRNKKPHSTKKCYRYVKRALLGGGVAKSYPRGEHAREAVGALKAQGMINMLDNPKYRGMIKSAADAPKGAVIVYWNGTKESGDVQIKTDWGTKGGYVSDFYNPYQSPKRDGSFLTSPKARRYADQGQPYKIIGVMIKP